MAPATSHHPGTAAAPADSDRWLICGAPRQLSRARELAGADAKGRADKVQVLCGGCTQCDPATIETYRWLATGTSGDACAAAEFSQGAVAVTALPEHSRGGVEVVERRSC